MKSQKLSKEIKEHFRKLGAKGGKARMKSLSAEDRKRLAREAGKASGRVRKTK